MDTLYIADDTAGVNGGIRKWSFDGTTWAIQGAFTGPCRGITGFVAANGDAVLFATTTTSTLIRVVDTATYDQPMNATSTGSCYRCREYGAARRGAHA